MEQGQARSPTLPLDVALYLNRRLRSQGIHNLNAVNYCTQIVDYCT